MIKTHFRIKYILGISIVAALGGLLFGYDWVVIGGAKPFYEAYFKIADNPALQGWAVSCALVGCIFGSLLSGLLTKKYSSRPLLIIASLLFLFSAIGTGMANNFTVFILYRIIGGIGIGLASNISPVYIAEIAPAIFRGRLVSLNQLSIVVGVLLAQITNYCIAEPIEENQLTTELLKSWNIQNAWRYMFWAEAVPSVFFFLLLWFVPDSPRWLILNKRNESASRILEKIGGKIYSENTILEIEKATQIDPSQFRVKQLLSKKIWPILVIGIVLATFQQFCGINVIFLYAEEVFSSAGYSVSGMLLNVVISGGVNLVFTLIALTLVDKIGRKTLLLIGAGGLCLIYTFVGLFYYNELLGLPLLLLIISAIAVYALTLAPITWVVLSEIFPNKIRGAGMAIATFALWISNTLLAYFFPVVNQKINSYGSFWLFAIICLLGFLFILYRVKETRGKSLEEIEKDWENTL